MEGKSELIKTVVMVSTSGSITIPKEIRRLAGIKPGDTLLVRFVREPGGRWIITLGPYEEPKPEEAKVGVSAY